MTDQTADFDFLQAEAEAIDAELNGQEFAALSAVESVNEAFRPAIVKFLSFVVGFINEKIPFTNQHFTPKAIEDIASSLIKVADVENVDLNKLIGDPNSRLGTWLTLAVAIGMPSFTFWLAIQEYKKQKSEKQVDQAKAEKAE